MPTYEDPGCLCKFCCPPCAVYQAQGFACPQMLGGCCCGWCYTLCCWDPTVGNPNPGVNVEVTVTKGAPCDVEMAR